MAKSYIIKHNTKEKIEVSAPSGGGGGGGGSGAGGAGGGGLSTGIDLGSSGPAFTVEPSQLIEDVKEILGISSSGFSTLLSNEAFLQNGAAAQGGNVLSPLATNLVQGENHEDSAKVIWNADSNSLFVVATLKQHEMVAEYLRDADRPRPNDCCGGEVL